MIQPGFRNLKRGRHVEYLLPVLNGDDAPRGEMLAVPRAVDLINNGQS